MLNGDEQLRVASDSKVNAIKGEFLFVKFRLGSDAFEFPGCNVSKLIIATQGFTRLGGAVLHFGGIGCELVFKAEVTTAGFVAVKCIVAHDFGKFEEVGDAGCFFKLSIDSVAASWDADIFPEFITNLRDTFKCDF